MAKQSLASQAAALQLPAIFQRPQAPVVARRIAPYITFAHPKRSDEWNKLIATFGSVEEGDMYLIEPESAHRLDPALVTLLVAKQYWAEANAGGEVLRTSYEEMPRPFKEHIEAVVLVLFDDTIVPANVQFRSTKCPAGKALADALRDASEASWAERSPAHRETMILQQPFMRFVGRVSLAPTRTSKTSGLPYRPATCRIQPTTMVEWRLFKSFSESEQTTKTLQDAAEQFERRIADVDRKIVKREA